MYYHLALPHRRLERSPAFSKLKAPTMVAPKKVFCSLTQLRPLTCSAVPIAARLASHPPDLVKWVKREGGFVHDALKIKQDATFGLGLLASREIPRDAELIMLPDHLPLRLPADSGEEEHDTVLLDLVHRVPEELWAMKLGLKLLQERAKVGSFWGPYISNLPETYSVPIFFTGDDIKNLQYAPLLYQVNKRCRFLLEFEQVVSQINENIPPSNHPFGGHDVDASSLGWALSAVSTRAFRLHGKKLQDGSCNDIPMMLPLIDMCNHSFNPNAQIVQEQGLGNTSMIIKVVAEKEIKQDEPLLLNYGHLSNDFFLLDYGFVIPSNPYDYIELKYDGGFLDAASMAAGIASPNFSSPSPWQQEILSQLDFHGEATNLKVLIGGSELVDGRLLAALRVILANDIEKVQKHDLSILKSLSSEAPVGIDTEVASFRTIIALCAIALEHFPSKIMDDEKLLKEGVSAASELAIQFRIHKKSVLIDVMRELSRRVKKLMSSSE